MQKCSGLLEIHKTYTLIEREPRMPHIRGIKGDDVPPVAGLRALENKDAEGVRPQAMGYYRLSRRVNKNERKKQNLYFTDGRDIKTQINYQDNY
jgi:hypothetical protein